MTDDDYIKLQPLAISEGSIVTPPPPPSPSLPSPLQTNQSVANIPVRSSPSTTHQYGLSFLETSLEVLDLSISLVHFLLQCIHHLLYLGLFLRWDKVNHTANNKDGDNENYDIDGLSYNTCTLIYHNDVKMHLVNTKICLLFFLSFFLAHSPACFTETLLQSTRPQKKNCAQGHYSNCPSQSLSQTT